MLSILKASGLIFKRLVSQRHVHQQGAQSYYCFWVREPFDHRKNLVFVPVNDQLAPPTFEG